MDPIATTQTPSSASIAIRRASAPVGIITVKSLPRSSLDLTSQESLATGTDDVAQTPAARGTKKALTCALWYIVFRCGP
ncbi:MAG: hypothetical protein HKL96_12470 [Phycisphaerales bacterium]|nr:hypothetical protein [Phycisphaerales bacterium]